MALPENLPIDLNMVYNAAVAAGYVGPNALAELLAWPSWANLPVTADSLADFLGVSAQFTINALDSPLEFDTDRGSNNGPSLIDATHFINFWMGVDNDGFCRIFEFDQSTGIITPLGTALEFDPLLGGNNFSLLIDSTHVINFWRGNLNVSRARIFEINPSTGAIIPLGVTIGFDTTAINSPSAQLIDASHVLLSWVRVGVGMYVQVFEVNIGTGDITTQGTALEFDTIAGQYTELVLISSTRAIVFWQGADNDGFAQMFDINNTIWEVTTLGNGLEFSTVSIIDNSPVLIDSNHIINFWTNFSSIDVVCRIFEIDTTNGTITALGTEFVIRSVISGMSISAQLIDSTHAIVFFGNSSAGWAQVVEFDTTTGAISEVSPELGFDSASGNWMASVKVNDSLFVTTWAGDGADGFAQVFEVS